MPSPLCGGSVKHIKLHSTYQVQSGKWPTSLIRHYISSHFLREKRWEAHRQQRLTTDMLRLKTNTMFRTGHRNNTFPMTSDSVSVHMYYMDRKQLVP